MTTAIVHIASSFIAKSLPFMNIDKLIADIDA